MTINVTSRNILWAIVALVLIGGAIYGGYALGNSNNDSKDDTTASETVDTDGDKDNTEATPDTSTTDTTTPTTSDQTTETPVYPCGEVVFNKGDSESAAGTTYWHSSLVNEGDQDCTLSGYPVTTMSDDFGNKVTAVNNPFYDVEDVVIPANGGTARIIVGSPNPGVVGPDVTCTSASTSVIQLALPDTEVSVSSAFGESVCEGFSISAIYAGT